MIFKAIFSTAWESINQNFYTRLAQTIDPIDSVISFYAEILSSGILKSLDKEGNDVTENDALIALLKNPNENQNFQQFIKEWLYYHYSHGWNYIVPQSTSVGFENKLDKGLKNSLYNVDPDHIKWNDGNSFFNLFKAKREISFDYEPYNFNAVKYSDVIPFIDVRQNPEKPYIGISRLLALEKQIQNYSLALQGDENLIKRSGSILVSLDSKNNEDMGLDSAVGTGRFNEDGTPITATHKQTLEQQLRETGLGNGSMGVMFSTLPLKSQPLSSGLENLKFEEKMIGYARQIFNKYNVPKEFQNLTNETAKFANRQMAMIEVIQNTIEPLANSFCNKIATYYKWENTISLDFSHLPVFSDNEETRTTTQQAIYDLYFKLFTDQQITQEQLTQILIDNGIIT
jgi:phage portal protein BeeE